MAGGQYAFNTTKQSFLATDLEVADGHLSRMRGLMFRRASSFAFGQALLIVPSHGVHTFFMRFAIDVIYLDAADRIIHIETGMQPWRLGPIHLDARRILETPAGTAWQSQCEIGDCIEIASSEEMGEVAA